MQAFKDLIIDAEMPTIEAMRQLDRAGRRTVFIAPGGRLQAVLTDSDVRKYILRGGDLAAPVTQTANPNPKWLPASRREDAQGYMVKYYIDALPLLDDDGVIVDVVYVNEADIPPKEQLGMPVVIMAGGLGSRLYPYTKILPKPLIPIGEVPILERVMENFVQYGCNAFSVVVNYRRNMIKSYFAELDKPYSIQWVDEESPLGTGGGLSLLKGAIDEPFFLTNCDILIEADYGSIARFHKQHGNAITLVCATKQFTIPYGVVELGAQGEYVGISEKPQMNYLTNTGMYVVEPTVLEGIAENTPLGFPDIVEAQRAAGKRVGVYPVGEAAWMDMGQMEELDEMRRRLEQG